MSMAALRWVRPVRCTPTQKVVLWALADHADDRGEAWPSIAGLIEATCLSERSVRGALRELEACGLIKTSPGGGRNRTSTYRLAMEQNGAARAETRQDLPRIEPEEKGQHVQEKGQILHERGQLAQEKGHVLPPNPQEPSRTLIEPPKRARAAPTIVAIPEWLPLDAWAEWCSHKGRKWGEGIGPTKALHLLRRYRDEGHDPREVIDHSIASGYAGLFPSKTLKPRAAAGKLDWVDNHPLFQRSA